MVLLTNEKTVRDITGINDNISSKQLIAAIFEAQETTYRRMVGSELYDKLIALVGNKSIDREPYREYKEILDHSSKVIAYSAVYRLVGRLGAKIGNLGINKATDTNLESTDSERIAKHYCNMADYYAISFVEWLKKHHHCGAFNEHIIESCGIWLGGKRGKR